MKSSAGTAFSYSLFGESHGAAVGITVNNLPAGFDLDLAQVDAVLLLRQGGATFNTARQEAPEYEILSGYFEGKLTGSPFTVVFRNNSTRSNDYANLITQPRPGHADYVARAKYNNANDYRGGGHFSGRLTTPLVFLGAIIQQIFAKKSPRMQVASHIKQFGPYQDTNYYDLRKKVMQAAFETQTDLDLGKLTGTMSDAAIIAHAQQAVSQLTDKFSDLDKSFPVLDATVKDQMQEYAMMTKKQHDTIGGKIETIVFAPDVALGEPFFNSVESVLSQLLFSVGSVKGIEFGLGTDFATSFGSEVKDEIIRITKDGAILTLFNYNGGINGGITNGEDIVVTTTLKPISSLFQKQITYNLDANRIQTLQIQGRHDSTIINRVIPVIEAVILIGLYDLYLQKQ